MTKPKRTLADALQAAAKPKPATKTIPSRPGKRAWVIYLDRDAARRLKAAAAMSDRSMQSLGVEAADLLIERYGMGRGGAWTRLDASTPPPSFN